MDTLKDPIRLEIVFLLSQSPATFEMLKKEIARTLKEDGVRIRLKRGGRHGSESVSDRGVHHGFEFFRDLSVFKRNKKRFF